MSLKRRRGVILDTNVWNYISDSGLGEDLDAIARDLNIQWLCPPSILLELARRPPTHKAERNRTIQLFSRGYRRVRLSADAEYESRELVDAIARHRPDWLRRFPDHKTWDMWHQYWTSGVWKAAWKNSDPLFEQQPLQGDARRVIEHQEEHRDMLRSEGFPFDSLGSVKTTVNLSGNRKVVVPVWRFELMNLFWKELIGKRAWVTDPTRDSTFADWIGCHVDLYRGIADRDGFSDFWLHQVEEGEIPRNWLRWAVHWAQIRQRITPGNPADGQHVGFLLDADIFVTADKPLIEVLARLAPQAPVRFATVVRFKRLGSQTITQDLRTLLESATE